MVAELLREVDDDEREDDDGKDAGARDDLAEAMAITEDELRLYRSVDAAREAAGLALSPTSEKEVPAWIYEGACGAGAADRAGANSPARLQAAAAAPEVLKPRAKKRNYTEMTQREFNRVLKGGSSAKPEKPAARREPSPPPRSVRPYRAAGPDQGEMRIRCVAKRRR